MTQQVRPCAKCGKVPAPGATYCDRCGSPGVAEGQIAHGFDLPMPPLLPATQKPKSTPPIVIAISFCCGIPVFGFVLLMMIGAALRDKPYPSPSQEAATVTPHREPEAAHMAEKDRAAAQKQSVRELQELQRKNDEANRPDLEVLNYKAINEGYSSYIVGTVRNNTDRIYSYAQVEINIYDKHGNQTGSTMANVNNLEPHTKWKFKALVFQEGRYTYAIKGVSGF